LNRYYRRGGSSSRGRLIGYGARGRLIDFDGIASRLSRYIRMLAR
jgi:hypothetical protein